MNHTISIFLITLISKFLFAHNEFIYPVAELDQDHLLLMHQQLSDNIALYVWNKNTKVAVPELNALYLPAHVQLLPSKNAYSFLDRGRIRIKSFCKRTPKTITIDEPICDIQSLHWISDEQCYFAAKIRQVYKIFLYDLSVDGGTLFTLSNMNNDMHYTFPCKIGDQLLSVGQSSDDIFHIICTDWQPKSYRQTRSDRLPLKTDTQEEQHLVTHFFPLCFLQMIDDQTGLILEMQPDTEHDDLFHFICYQIALGNTGILKMHQLFEFSAPKSLIIGHAAERLYESIYPLLPRYFNKTIYFTNYDQQTKKCMICKYDTGVVQPLQNPIMKSLATSPSHTFAPFLTQQEELLSGYHLKTPEYRSGCIADDTFGIKYCHLPKY